MAMSLLSLIIDSPTPSNFAWEGTVDLSLFTIHGDVSEALLIVGIICAVSLLGTAVWLLAGGAHLRSGDAQRA